MHNYPFASVHFLWVQYICATAVALLVFSFSKNSLTNLSHKLCEFYNNF